MGDEVDREARTIAGSDSHTQLRVSLDPRIAAVEGFARRKLLPDDPARRPCALADAQFVIARAHGFSSWPAFAAHVEALTSRASAVTEFEHAADAIINGDIAGLERRLRADPAWS